MTIDDILRGAPGAAPTSDAAAIVRAIGLGSGLGSGLPYGADNYAVTNVTAGPATIVFKLGSTVLKTRTLTYTNSGASASDVLINVVDT